VWAHRILAGFASRAVEVATRYLDVPDKHRLRPCPNQQTHNPNPEGKNQVNALDLSRKIATALPTYSEQLEAEEQQRQQWRGEAYWENLQSQSDAHNTIAGQVRALDAEIAQEHGHRAVIQKLAERLVTNTAELATLKVEGELEEAFGVTDKQADNARKKKVEALTGHNRAISKEQIPAAVAKLRAALRDDDGQTVRTAYGYGYRLVAEVRAEAVERSAEPSPLALEAGQAVAGRRHWLLQRRLGEGGHGEVWLVEHWEDLKTVEDQQGIEVLRLKNKGLESNTLVC
jgi:hypothetical protein